jgi:hypothetical protein
MMKIFYFKVLDGVELPRLIWSLSSRFFWERWFGKRRDNEHEDEEEELTAGTHSNTTGSKTSDEPVKGRKRKSERIKQRIKYLNEKSIFMRVRGRPQITSD